MWCARPLSLDSFFDNPSRAILTYPLTAPAQMKLSVMLSVGVALLPEIASADGGFFHSCRDNVGFVFFLLPSRSAYMNLLYGNSGVWRTTS